VEDSDFATAVVAWANGRTVACAESCTAGRLSQAFAAVDGALAWFRGGIVAYQAPVKRALLAVTETSVLSEAAAAEMAVGVAALLSADVTVATSGVIGGDPQDGVAPGTVFIATSVDGTVVTRTHHLEGEPQHILDAAVRQALRDLLLDVGAVAGEAPPQEDRWAQAGPKGHSGGASSKDQSGRFRAWRSS
jgi:PncC family amidohydrolase